MNQSEDWLVLHTRAGKEKVAHDNLLNQQIEAQFFEHRVRRPNGGKNKFVARPLYQRYIFIRPFDLDSTYARIRSTRGVIDFVRFGEQYDRIARIPDEAVQEIASRRDAAGYVVLPEEPVADEGFAFAHGEIVRIIEGAFAGFTGKYLGRAKRGAKVEVYTEKGSFMPVIVPPAALVALAAAEI